VRRRSVRLVLVVFGVAAVGAGVALSASGGVSKRNQGLVAILGVLRRAQTRADLSFDDYGMLPDLVSRYTPVRALIRLANPRYQVFLVPLRPRGQHNNSDLRLAAFAAQGGECCSTAALIRAHGMVSGGAPNELVVVVPDGVAKITARWSRSPTFKHSYAVSGTVHSNVAVFTQLPVFPEKSLFELIWYRPSGAVIKRTN
jgi:hypothetical protein